ncbi:hypothetical protein H4582DRAFT_2195469 [Lactarius indigo]|nr:hypothetical protein H4582DRAFT_2195469 [Lactarius indigo]
MNYPHTAATDPYAFSLWPDAAASSEETMAWAQATGYAQPGLTIDNFSFDDLGATVAWGQSATLFDGAFGLQNISDTDWTSGGTAPAEDMLGLGVSLADAAAADTMAFAPAPTLPSPTDPTDGIDVFPQDLFFTQSDFFDSLSGTPCRSPPPACDSFVLTQSKAPTDGSSAPSPESDGTGDGFLPFPTFEGAASYFPPGPSLTQLDIAGELQPDQFTYAPPLWFMGDGNLSAQLPPNYLASLALVNMNGNMSYTQVSNAIGLYPSLRPYHDAYRSVDHDGHRWGGVIVLPWKTESKANDEDSEDEEPGPQQRARRNAIGVPGGTGSTKRTRRSPATRTRQNINGKSKAAGRGAERLASTIARGVYHRFLPGLSVPQGSVEALEQGQPSWIEERDVETRHDMGSLPQQQIVLQSAENAEVRSLHKIPGNLSERERLMLDMTQADEERGAVRMIKCKLCSKSPLKSWEIYKRHCKSCEKHPSKPRFCPKCGDYFGRPDSGVRHRKDKKYQKVCLETSQVRSQREEAEGRTAPQGIRSEAAALPEEWRRDWTPFLRHRE